MSRVWTWIVVAFWALTMGFLLREKVMPGLLQTYYPTYPAGVHQLQDEKYQMGIFLSGQKNESRIGVSRTSIDSLAATSANEPAWSVHDETTIDPGALGLNLGNDLTIRTTTLLDSWFHVKTYDVLIRTGIGDFVLNGVVRDENTLEIQVRTPFQSEPEKRSLYFDSAMALASGLSPFLATPELRIGREWTIHQIDPTGVVFGGDVKTKPLLARVERMESIVIEGKRVDAFVVSLHGDRYEARAWVGEDGKILQERVPSLSSGVPLVMRREAWTEARR